MNRYALALRMQDREMVQDSLVAMRRFNRKNPTVVITSKALKKSLKAWARVSGQAQHGIILSKNLRGLSGEVRFALQGRGSQVNERGGNFHLHR
ncbi:hypothetical protein Nhal_1141 [Nitrosococcus halophilus Nc 4]|uniref:Uncharacterized protein n=2 Tax=Nitrosococcus halophilus TaxID=133539 RepID=D5BZL4_NITHN|nr:hypothetical protein Nhal_1141 [Nitrosococcus halophilus Nc 4]